LVIDAFHKAKRKDVSGYAKVGNAFQHYKDPVIALNLCNLSTNIKHQR